jgi:hypothetical protein
MALLIEERMISDHPFLIGFRFTGWLLLPNAKPNQEGNRQLPPKMARFAHHRDPTFDLLGGRINDLYCTSMLYRKTLKTSAISFYLKLKLSHARRCRWAAPSVKPAEVT